MKTSLRFLSAAWFVFGGVIGSPTPCAANATVTLNPEVTISRATVKLGDLFNGVPSDIDRDIAQAPQPCKPATYSENVLNKLAQTYRLDWQKQDKNGAAADHSVVASACARLSGDKIRDMVVARIKDEADIHNRAVDIEFDGHAPEFDLPGEHLPDVALENFAYDPISRHFKGELSAMTTRGMYSLPVTGHASVKRSVPVLAHRTEGGTTLGDADLEFIQVADDRITADIVTEPSQLIGRELRRDTGEGEILHSHDVVPPRLVTRGSLVTMKIETPLITITTQGKAQQDGAQGDAIRVVNTQSSRIVEGTVTGPGIVDVRTTQKLASVQ